MLSSRIGLKPLSVACRSLSTMLDAGIDVRKAFRVAADKTYDPRCRQALADVADSVRRGDPISTAMHALGDRFPRLMIDMVAVAEETGALPEIFAGLSNHYENNVRLRRHFWSQVAWPLFQFTMAVLVIAFLILVLGWIAETKGGEPMDILGWGLVGEAGAVRWLFYCFGSICVLTVAYRLTARSLAGKRFLHPFLLQIPVLGHCMRSFAVARFSWAFSLTQKAGMSIDKSLEASFRATSNGAFLAAAPEAWAMLHHGETLTETLRAINLFPAEFIEMVDVAETSGTVPEALERLSPQFEDQARRSLSALTVAFSWLVWIAVAALIIYLIFSIIARVYLDPINEALQNTF